MRMRKLGRRLTTQYLEHTREEMPADGVEEIARTVLARPLCELCPGNLQLRCGIGAKQSREDCLKGAREAVARRLGLGQVLYRLETDGDGGGRALRERILLLRWRRGGGGGRWLGGCTEDESSEPVNEGQLLEVGGL